MRSSKTVVAAALMLSQALAARASSPSGQEGARAQPAAAQSHEKRPSSFTAADREAAGKQLLKLMSSTPRPIEYFAGALPKMKADLLKAALEALVDDGRVIQRGRGTPDAPFTYLDRAGVQH
jgi:hypothetical protein